MGWGSNNFSRSPISRHLARHAALAFALVLTTRLTADQHAATEMATTQVLEVQWSEVVLAAGSMDGLAMESAVTLLREGEPIVHPVTGAVLGTPQEPVGSVLIFELEDHRARGRLTKMYSEPMVGDLAEYARREATPAAAKPAPAAEAVAVVKRVQELEESVEKYQKASADMKTYPGFARRVWDELAAMRSYLAALDERLADMEDTRAAERSSMSSMMSGEYRPEDYKELTIRYTPDTQLKLQAAGKTVLISVVRDTLHMEPVTAMAETPVAETEQEEEGGFAALFGWGDDDEDEDAQEIIDESEVSVDSTDDLSEDLPWYKSGWHLAGGIGLVLALLLVVALIVRKRYSEVMDGLDEFEDDYFDDDDDEDEDEDEDEY